jgi:hypothetical protein
MHVVGCGLWVGEGERRGGEIDGERDGDGAEEGGGAERREKERSGGVRVRGGSGSGTVIQ